LSGAGTLNGSGVAGTSRSNGRAHAAECTCPTCGSVIPEMVHKAILGRQRAHDAEIERAVGARFAKQIAEAEKKRKSEIDAAVKAATKSLRDGQTGVVTAAIQAERERADKAVADAVNATKLEFATERVRLESALADLQKKVQAKSPFDRGEPAEVSLFDAIVAAVPPTDVVRRVEKGRPGVDVVVEIVHGNTVVGKIAIDSKAHARWQNAFCVKLRQDQLRENAAFGILSSSVFPKGASQLHVQDGVIVCHPDRVPVLVSLLRRIILDGHTQKRGSEARNKKAEAVLKFLLSKQADDLFAKLVSTTRSLEALDMGEVKSHQSTWTKRSGLIREILQVHDSFTGTIGDIIGGGQ
jgi:hypothetical protein